MELLFSLGTSIEAIILIGALLAGLLAEHPNSAKILHRIWFPALANTLLVSALASSTLAGWLLCTLLLIALAACIAGIGFVLMVMVRTICTLRGATPHRAS